MKINSLFLLLLLITVQTGHAADFNDLFSAAMFGKTERVKSILADGVDVNAKHRTNWACCRF